MDHTPHHAHGLGLDAHQITDTAIGVYAGVRASQGDLTPLMILVLLGGGISFSGLFSGAFVLILVGLAVAIIGAALWLGARAFRFFDQQIARLPQRLARRIALGFFGLCGLYFGLCGLFILLPFLSH